MTKSRAEAKKRKKANMQQFARKRQQMLQKVYQNVAPSHDPVQVQQTLPEEFKQLLKRHEELATRKAILQEQEQSQSFQSRSQAKAKNEAVKGMSKRKLKVNQWLRVAKLKEMVKRPDLVEAWDIASYDPLYLIHLKSVKNTIEVPRHWNNKSKFLQTKRGILKPPFKLPDYIESTGISKLRDPFLQNATAMVKEKLRERMNPRLGKIDIDYQVLHDAFFKYQTKSKLTLFGEVYFQGKQNQAGSRQFRPGILSEELRRALGIGDFSAPPWTDNMQRYGPPPAYPTLRLLGSNPILGDINNFTLVTRAVLQQYARRTGKAGLYASFRGFSEEKIESNNYQLWGQFRPDQVEVPQPEDQM